MVWLYQCTPWLYQCMVWSYKYITWWYKLMYGRPMLCYYHQYMVWQNWYMVWLYLYMICGVLASIYAVTSHGVITSMFDAVISIYNDRHLLRSTRYPVDRVWYWLTDAVGMYMVPSRVKSKVSNCFIKLSGILHEIGLNHKETSKFKLFCQNTARAHS